MQSLGRISRWTLCASSLGLAGLLGCAHSWDDLTSKEFKASQLFTKPDPMTILRDSTDGAKRGWALSQLKEPLEHGGTQEDQDNYIQILSTAALKEKFVPLLPLGAIRALCTYKDPRAGKILEEVYLQKPRFTPEINTQMRQLALNGLVRPDDPETRHLLIRVARQPGAGGDSSYADRQQTNDERLVAIRGLAKYKQSDAIETLVYVLENEKDVALRDRAHESLKTATGKTLPQEGKAWREFLVAQGSKDGPPPEQPGFFRKMFQGN